MLHFIWQGVVLSLAAVVLLRVARSCSAAFRYLLTLGLLTLAPLSFAATVATQLRFSGASESAIQLTTLATPAALLSGSAAPAVLKGGAFALTDPRRMFAVVALCWLVVVLILTIRLASAWRSTARLSRTLARFPVPATVQTLAETAFRRARQRMGVVRPGRVVCVSGAHTAVVVGWLRILVVLPLSVVTSLTPLQVELIVAHELAHVRRHDFLANVLQSCVEMLFFFHPGVRWLSGRVRLERELACDDAVVAAYDQSAEYGSALARLALLPVPTSTLAVAATASPLVLRIRRRFDGVEPAELAPSRWPAALAAPAALLALLIGGQLAAAQSAARSLFLVRQEPRAARVIAQHSHANRFWARSRLTLSALPDGQLESELRLGRRFGAKRFLARLQPVAHGDTAVLSLAVEVYGSRGKRVLQLLPAAPGIASDDARIATFLRESGLNAFSIARGIARASGVGGVVLEVDRIGDSAVQLEYLRAGMAAATSAEARAQLLRVALRVRNNPVDVGSVLLAAIRAARSPTELVTMIDRIPEVSGEAERLALLLAATAVAERRFPTLEDAVKRGAMSLPGEDARAAVRQALSARP